jgi:NAD(P)-dependent dehydrogenase (short-subunit alcohol dehydrogenase family)
MGTLDGQSCVVLGGAGGIGAAVVRGYLAEGARVLAVDRAPERVEELASELGAGADLITLAADTTSWAVNCQLVERAVEAFGRLDVLTSCVGIFDQGIPLSQVPGDRLAAAAEESFGVNVTSLLLGVRAALAQLVANRGRVVLTASFASFEPSGGGVLYTAAKHAVVGVVRQLAYELAPDVRVNAVAPGVAATMMAGLTSLDQQPRNAVLQGTENVLPLGRIPDPADYAATYTLLASPTGSAAMTGTVVPVDSGLLIRGLTTPVPNR